MKGKDLIKWIHDNKAEDLELYMGIDWKYHELSPAIERAGYGKRDYPKLCVLTDKALEDGFGDEAKANLYDKSNIDECIQEGTMEKVLDVWVNLMSVQ